MVNGAVGSEGAPGGARLGNCAMTDVRNGVMALLCDQTIARIASRIPSIRRVEGWNQEEGHCVWVNGRAGSSMTAENDRSPTNEGPACTDGHEYS